MAASKKPRKVRVTRTRTEIAVTAIISMPLGELSRLPTALVEADEDAARFLWAKLSEMFHVEQTE